MYSILSIDRFSKGSARFESDASPLESDSVLPNEIKQGWGQVPKGHWIVADSQANNHDENTAVNVYYQMPFSTTQNKVLLLQQVSCASASCHLVYTCLLMLFFLLTLLCDLFILRLQTAELAVFSAIARQKCFETLRTVLFDHAELFRCRTFQMQRVIPLQVQQLGYIATCGARRFLSSLGFFALVQVCAVDLRLSVISSSPPHFNDPRFSRVITWLL